MRFKDKLRAFRLEKNLTQKELSEAIFVSRSAVAKWENGLGLPSAASYEALLLFFGITSLELPLNEEEEEPKIRRRVIFHIIGSIVSWTMILALATAPFILLYAVMNGYGFTSKMAAGEIWEDNEVISTPEYDFYISTFDITDENSEVCDVFISSFCVVEKRFYGYQKIEPHEYRRLIFDDEAEGDINDKRYGLIYSIPGENCYYNIFKSKITLLGPIESTEDSASVPVDQNFIKEIYINGERIEMQNSSFFVTEDLISEFDVIEYNGEDHHLKVKNTYYD